jgi:hypothetical protein
MTWVMSIHMRRLEVDLAPGVRGREWEELLDAIVRELDVVDRVMFLVPRGFEAGPQAQHLDGLVRILTARGVDVERRQTE